MKHTANIITVSRLLAAFAILFTEPLSAAFFTLYLYGGISDILDGYIARTKRITSRLGSVLDSIADTAFILIVMIRVLPVLAVPQWLLWWIGLIVVIRVSGYATGFVKYRTFSSLHTYLNKLSGLLLFLFPVFYLVLGLPTSGFLLCLSATVSAGEELLITVKAKELDRDVKGNFGRQ